MSVFPLRNYFKQHYHQRNASSGLYVNDYNYFNKNNIKMSQIRQRTINNNIKDKQRIRNKLHMPKMLYSNIFIGDIQDEGTQKDDTPELCGEYLCENTNNNNNKLIIKTENNIQHNEKNKTISHVRYQSNLFDDLLDCVDNLEIQDARNENGKCDNNSNKQVHINSERNIKTSSRCITPTHKVKIAKCTDITDESIIKKIKQQYQSPKNLLKLGSYHRYKFTKGGVNYPSQLSPTNYTLPSFTGTPDDSKELRYFNYRKKINNPSKIYNNIGSFSEKFNVELARISKSYGKEESKGRFVENPLLGEYRNVIPYYDLYKDMKFIENRYADNKRFKFRLLPLVNAKLRNFDRLGNKLYQSAINTKHNVKLSIDTRNKKK